MMDDSEKLMVIDPKGMKISREDYVKVIIIQAIHSLGHTARYLNREHDTLCGIDGLDQSEGMFLIFQKWLLEIVALNCSLPVSKVFRNEYACHYLDHNVVRLATLMSDFHEVKPYVCIDGSSKLSYFVDLRKLTLKKLETRIPSTLAMVEDKLLALAESAQIDSCLSLNAENGISCLDQGTVGETMFLIFQQWFLESLALDCSLPISEVLQNKYACHFLDGDVVRLATLMPNIHDMKPGGCIDGSFIDLQNLTLKMLEAWVFPRVAILDNMLLLLETGYYALLRIAETWMSLDSCCTDQLPTKTLQAERGQSTRHLLRGHRALVSCVSWSPDDEFLLTRARGEVLMIWDVCMGECTYEINERPESVATSCSRMVEQLIVDISITPNGSKLVIICSEGKIAVLHIHKEKAEIVVHSVTEDSESLILNLNIHQIHAWGVEQEMPGLWLTAVTDNQIILYLAPAFGGFQSAFLVSGSEDSKVRK